MAAVLARGGWVQKARAGLGAWMLVKLSYRLPASLAACRVVRLYYRFARPPLPGPFPQPGAGAPRIGWGPTGVAKEEFVEKQPGVAGAGSSTLGLKKASRLRRSPCGG